MCARLRACLCACMPVCVHACVRVCVCARACLSGFLPVCLPCACLKECPHQWPEAAHRHRACSAQAAQGLAAGRSHIGARFGKRGGGPAGARSAHDRSDHCRFAFPRDMSSCFSLFLPRFRPRLHPPLSARGQLVFKQQQQEHSGGGAPRGWGW